MESDSQRLWQAFLLDEVDASDSGLLLKDCVSIASNFRVAHVLAVGALLRGNYTDIANIVNAENSSYFG